MEAFQHQIDVLNRAIQYDRYALFLEQGLGKTKIAIDIAEHHFMNDHIDGVIVVTTKGLIANWYYTELPKHSTCWWRAFAWGKSKTLMNPDPDKLDWFICNIDGLASQGIVPYLREFIKDHPRLALFIDESTVVKNMKAKRTKLALQLSKRCKYRYIMSGTPVTNSPIDLFSQCEILEPGILGHNSLYSFKGRYCQMQTMRLGTRSFDKIVGYKNLDQLTAKVQEFASILKKEDCLDLPDKIYRTVPVDFTPEQEKAYTELRDKALTYIDDKEITVVNAISLINRLLQICAGQIKIGENYLSINNNRLEVLKDLVEEASGKTIIWTSFVNTATDIMKTLDDAIHLPSGLTIDKRQEIIDAFRTDPSIKALVANPASAGHGITLVESSNVIYYSNSWNYEHRAQSEDRAHRIGQTKNVLYTDLITPNTVEVKVVELLQQKKNLADIVITNEEIRNLLDVSIC